MRHFILAVLYFLLTTSVSQSAFFKDAAPVVLPLEYQNFEALGYYNVGYLERDDKRSCTATILNPKTIITSAHCINNNEEWADVRKFTFHIAINGDEPRTLHVKIKWTPTKKPLINYGALPRYGAHLIDIALLEPIEKVKLNRKVFLAKTQPTEGLPLHNFGITTFVNSLIVLNNKCEIKSNFHEYIYNLNCGAIPGMSGSGFFVEEYGNLNLIGILTGVKIVEPPFKLIDYSEDTANYGLFFDDSYQIIREMKKHI